MGAVLTLCQCSFIFITWWFKLISFAQKHIKIDPRFRAWMKSSVVVQLESRSVKNLTERFSRLVSSESRRSELEKTLFHLKSERLRNTASAKTFAEHGGLQASMALSRKLAPATKSDAKLLALLWGTMANLCSLDRQARSKVGGGASEAVVFGFPLRRTQL